MVYLKSCQIDEKLDLFFKILRDGRGTSTRTNQHKESSDNSSLLCLKKLGFLSQKISKQELDIHVGEGKTEEMSFMTPLHQKEAINPYTLVFTL